jgi:GDP-L-fucose synthase
MMILVTGATGLVGSAIFEHFVKCGYTTKGISTKDVDLTDRNSTFEYVCDLKPEVVIDAAAVVGGIGANDLFPVEFLSKNLQIQSNLMDASNAAGVERFVFLGSSCIYPRDCPQPIKEEYLLTGPLEQTNSAYAIAKIAGVELIKSYRKQFGHKWISLMPTNMYGPKDNFDSEKGHVLPALINRFVTARKQGLSKVVLWGTGTPRREFLHSRDFASAVMVAVENYDEEIHLNVGTGTDISIQELALKIANLAGFNGEIKWDTSRPDGTPRKVLDISRLQKLNWAPSIGLGEGISETIHWFEAQDN